jgi:hypothetical protein
VPDNWPTVSLITEKEKILLRRSFSSIKKCFANASRGKGAIRSLATDNILPFLNGPVSGAPSGALETPALDGKFIISFRACFRKMKIKLIEKILVASFDGNSDPQMFRNLSPKTSAFCGAFGELLCATQFLWLRDASTHRQTFAYERVEDKKFN